MKKIIALILALMSIMAVAIPALAQTGLPVGSTAYTIKGDVAVRRSGEVRSDNIISRVNTGTAVTILQTTNKTNGWYRVQVDGLTSNGYIREDCLGANQPQASELPYYETMYTTKSVNVRSAPSKKADVLEVFGRGTMVKTKAITSDGIWVKLFSPKENAYIMKEFLSTEYIGTTTSQNRPYDASSAFGTKTLVRGSAGNAVINLQIALNDLGYLGEPDNDSEIDGTFGSKTEQAVKNFQKYIKNYEDSSFSVDGKVGPATKEKLWKYAGVYLKNEGIALN